MLIEIVRHINNDTIVKYTKICDYKICSVLLFNNVLVHIVYCKICKYYFLFNINFHNI